MSALQQTHRIRQLRFSCRSADADAALNRRAQLARTWEALLPVFERAFDRAAAVDAWIRVPRLEMSFTLEDFDLPFERVSGRVAERLAASLDEALGAMHLDQAPSLGGADADATVEAAPRPTGAARAHVTSTAGRDLELLMNYLECGDVPWHALTIDELATGLREACRGEAGELRAWLRNHLTGRSVSRWLRLLPHDLRASEVREFLATLPAREAVDHWVAAIPALLDGELPTRSAVHGNGWLTAALVSAGTGGPPDAGWFDLAMRGAFELTPAEQAKWTEILAGTGLTPEQIEEILFFSQAAVAGAPLASDEGTIEPDGEPAPIAESIQDASGSESPGDAAIHSRRVLYAGSVLLHPYLPRLFANCGIGFAGRDIHPHDLAKAAALLYYSAVGREEALDFELLGARLLLGLGMGDVDAPGSAILVDEGILTGRDKAEVDSMLSALIGHWSRLGNTSVAGLRRAFLQRAGLLMAGENLLELKIDRQGHDVLLDTLPWSISIVRLPWMPMPVHVTW